jgi:carboxymethylenebutenolidase
MGEWVNLQAADGHMLKGWKATPKGKPKGGLLVVQEIFGVNAHIRDVTERFAKLGYLAIAPAMFDRYERDYEAEASAEAIEHGRHLMHEIKIDLAVKDMEAARQAVGGAGRVGIVGYCFGGSMAYLAACRLKIDGAVAYYGHLETLKSETPRCPVIAHFASQDHTITAENIREFTDAQPKVPVHIYDAGHGFNRDGGRNYDAPAAKQALDRTLKFLTDHVG